MANVSSSEAFLIPPAVPADLPSLLICWEQRQCVFRLSDAKVAALQKCIAAMTTTATQSPPPPPEPSQITPTTVTQPPQTTQGPRTLIQRRRSLRQQTVSLGAASELRRRIIITFSMQELIVQLDSQGRALAECRLGSTAARCTRFSSTDHLTVRYEVGLQVHSLTVADALCGLGADFDLLAASHRGVRCVYYSLLFSNAYFYSLFYTVNTNTTATTNNVCSIA